MDLNKVVEEKIKEINVDEIFQRILREQIEKTVKDVLHKALGNYSPFSKKFEELVEKNLAFDPTHLSLPQYSNFVVEQAHQVISVLMNEERASLIRQTLIEKLGGHIAKEIEFGRLISDIEAALLSSYDELDCCDDKEYRVVCKREEKTYSSERVTFGLYVYHGADEKFTDEIAAVFVMDEEAYHSRGSRREPLARLFGSYTYMRTKIHGIEPYDRTITREDKY